MLKIANGLYLDDESMLVFWDKVNELNVPVYLHPREPWKALRAVSTPAMKA
jgi:hypothetical protein